MTEEPGVLQLVRLQRVGPELVTEQRQQQQQQLYLYIHACVSVPFFLLSNLRINTFLDLFINAFYGYPMYSSHTDTLVLKSC